MRYADYPRQTVEDIARLLRLLRRLDAANLPPSNGAARGWRGATGRRARSGPFG